MFRCRSLLVLLMSLWLPLQGVAAVVMPFCQHSLAADGPQMQHGEQAAAQHGGGMEAGHHGTSPEQQPDSVQPLLTACDDCGHCNLSCASTLPSAPPQAGAPILAAIAPHAILPALAGIVPHRLNRPPLPA